MKKKVLVIDDSAYFRGSMELILSAADYDVIPAETGRDGLALVKSEKPDLVLLDIVMPDISGFEVCATLRDSDSNNLMPIILLTSRDDQEDKLVGLELGADDYITKPFNERELLSRIRNTLRRIDRNRAANPLTGLPGNLEIQREIESRIARDEPYAVIYIDLDNFKPFNDVYGFARGDMAIKLTAEILEEEVKEAGLSGGFVGHIGGDDFVMVTSAAPAEALCQAVIRQFDEKIRLLYNPRDLEQGHISSKNRRGEVETYPVISISLAVITNEYRRFLTHLEISDTASELKQLLKAMPGSNYFKDRRRDTPRDNIA